MQDLNVWSHSMVFAQGLVLGLHAEPQCRAPVQGAGAGPQPEPQSRAPVQDSNTWLQRKARVQG